MSIKSDGVDVSVDDSGLDLDWGFWDAQLRAIEALESGEYDVVVFRGGYGSGKTILGARYTIEKALEVPRSDNLIIAPDSQTGAPTTYKVFFEQLPGEDTVPEEGGDPENSPIITDYNRNESRLTVFNGSVIRLGSADVWNRYAGGEFNTIWCDEVAHYEHTDLFKLNRMLISRQRTSRGPNVTLWTSTGNGYNQFYDFVERQETPDDEELPTRITNIIADSRNNPFLEEKEKLTRQFEGTEKAEQGLAGGFAAAEGLVYPTFSRGTHVVSRSDVEVVDDWRIYGYDYGFKHPRVLLEIGKTPADQYVVLDCYYRTEMPLDHLIDPDDGTGWVLENEKPTGAVYCDHDPEHIQKFRDAGFSAAAATKDIDEGIDEVRGVLEVDETVGPGLLVVEDCTELIKEFQSYKEDDVGTSRAEDHALDSLRYAVMGDRYVADAPTVRRRSGSSPTKGNLK
jgi:phage terminase large subunit